MAREAGFEQNEKVSGLQAAEVTSRARMKLLEERLLLVVKDAITKPHRATGRRFRGSYGEVWVRFDCY